MLDVQGARCPPRGSEQVWDMRGRRARPPQPCPSWPAAFLESGPRFPSPSPLPPAAWAPANLLRNHFQRKVSFPSHSAGPLPHPPHGLALGPAGTRTPLAREAGGGRPPWPRPPCARPGPSTRRPRAGPLGTMALCLGVSGPMGRPSWASWACRPGLAPPRAAPGGHAAP